ncbi:alpha-D-ribose 1-methylphosphonate 5-triphosphate diphosphatase [Paenibacillus sp. LHD-117]|uniref:alpha-D-ribose 1-methylphosphonate 5-triphosphate diphosphatase n=1 Tax=Paenibacillus sp. LHD-117 TaxID=3071412 RepID=UPI0027E04976|nr:alpha-D-ribose 1-methylphosphonate 5-triphosphate diphosphatase [Paenibacillus sp. LHD-117]MDQ6420267.1 alpha-D-ribose 1-methylphosphonate 5-triphosphate diphosphatase [Paenibacillus sp. LHD-117]
MKKQNLTIPALMDRPSQPMLVLNGQLVLRDRVVQGSVGIVDGRIHSIFEHEGGADKGESEGQSVARFLETYSEAVVIDAAEKYVLPGLIDIHCDAIEKEVQPRPGTLFPLELALLEFERKLPLHGITTMYHSLSLGVGLSLRGDHLLTGMVELIGKYNERRSMIRNLIHLRFEVSHHAGLPVVERYIQEGAIQYLSFMDHSPGYGQYRKPGSFERYVMKNQGVTMDEVKMIVDELAERRKAVDSDRLRRLGLLASEIGIGVASHDDDTPEQVDRSIGLGANVSEFPITMETAKYAAGRGMSVCVGAPNIVRGVSHDGNLSASEAIREGAANIICSDYHPSSLLSAIFKLAEEGTADLPLAVRMASLHPAQAMRIDDRLGSIEQGKSADLIVVGRYEGIPWVSDTIVGGTRVYGAAVRY